VSEHAAAVPHLYSVLDESEREAARRFHFHVDRQRYVVAHGILRLLLGTYVGAAPGALHFTGGEFGKPALATRAGLPVVEFNLSHSGDLIAVAVTRGSPVGVDVEAVIELPDAEALAAHVFSAAERVALRRVADVDRMRAFFSCWTRKEAYIKGTGLGLSAGLDYFDVSLAPGEPAALLADRRREASAEWALHDIDAPAGYAGAIACARALAAPARFTLSAALARTLVERAA
jgi:4'-phosphopantetheinyl transferase